MGFLPYEAILKEYEGIDFRNRPGKFEIVKHNTVILSSPDDNLGTVGCSVVSRIMESAKTTLSSSYLGSKRMLVDGPQAMASVSQERIARALPNLRSKYPQVSRSINALEKMAPIDPEADDLASAVKRAEYLGEVMTMFTWFRGQTIPPVYEDNGRPANGVIVVEYVTGKNDSTVDGVLPNDGEKFSDDEMGIVRLLTAAGKLKLASDEAGQYLVRPSRDVFELIGDEFRMPPVIPPLTGNVERAPAVVVVPQPSPSPARTCHSSPSACRFQKALDIYREYVAVDANKFPELRSAIRVGGFTPQAKELYAQLPKGRKAKLFEGIGEEGPMPFSAVVEVLAERLGVEGGDELAEVVAVRLVSAKSCFKLDSQNVVTRK